MLLTIPPLAALCWVCLRRGISALSSMRLRSKWAALGALIIESLVAHILTPGAFATLCIVVVSLLLLRFFYSNHSLPGISLVMVGIGMNLAAMLANGGFMPMGLATAASIGVSPGVTVIGHHLIGTKDVLLPLADQRLAVLGDRLTLPPAFGALSKTAYSLGDIVLSVGLSGMIARSAFQRDARAD